MGESNFVTQEMHREREQINFCTEEFPEAHF